MYLPWKNMDQIGFSTAWSRLAVTDVIIVDVSGWHVLGSVYDE